MNARESLLSAYPDIATEWHPTKNAGVTPDMVPPRTGRKAWWLGKCGHEWEAAISSRTRGVGCPYCRNYFPLVGYNDLATINPDLAKEWSIEKNNGLKPTDVTAGSHKKVWWKCINNHEWEASVRDRIAGNSCPYCSGRKVLAGYNDLETVNPELSKEWNYEKNGDLKPNQVLPGSEKKVWWICSQGHEWSAIIYNRNKGIGCPYCTNFSILSGYNDLATTNPQLAQEWNYEKNGDLKPTDVTPGSHKKIWWKCSNGHEWQAGIKSRNSGNGCPYCSNKVVLTGFNDLASTYPNIAREWSARNTIAPQFVIRGGDQKYYWICPLGHEDYLSSVDQRIRGQGCPQCAQQSQTSFPEQAIFYYVKLAFPDALNRYRIGKNEIDVYIPSKHLGIEYNGYFSHKGKEKKDEAKKTFLLSRGIQLLTIKEYKQENECQGAEFYIHERTTYESITNLVNEILLSVRAILE